MHPAPATPHQTGHDAEKATGPVAKPRVQDTIYTKHEQRN